MSMQGMTTAALAEEMFNAYGEHCGWKTFDGRDMPRWADITALVQSHWEAAALAATALLAPKTE